MADPTTATATANNPNNPTTHPELRHNATRRVSDMRNLVKQTPQTSFPADDEPRLRSHRRTKSSQSVKSNKSTKSLGSKDLIEEMAENFVGRHHPSESEPEQEHEAHPNIEISRSRSKSFIPSLSRNKQEITDDYVVVPPTRPTRLRRSSRGPLPNNLKRADPFPSTLKPVPAPTVMMAPTRPRFTKALSERPKRFPRLPGSVTDLHAGSEIQKDHGQGGPEKKIQEDKAESDNVEHVDNVEHEHNLEHGENLEHEHEHSLEHAENLDHEHNLENDLDLEHPSLEQNKAKEETRQPHDNILSSRSLRTSNQEVEQGQIMTQDQLEPNQSQPPHKDGDEGKRQNLVEEEKAKWHHTVRTSLSRSLKGTKSIVREGTTSITTMTTKAGEKGASLGRIFGRSFGLSMKKSFKKRKDKDGKEDKEDKSGSKITDAEDDQNGNKVDDELDPSVIEALEGRSTRKRRTVVGVFDLTGAEGIAAHVERLAAEGAQEDAVDGTDSAIEGDTQIDFATDGAAAIQLIESEAAQDTLPTSEALPASESYFDHFDPVTEYRIPHNSTVSRYDTARTTLEPNTSLDETWPENELAAAVEHYKKEAEADGIDLDDIEVDLTIGDTKPLEFRKRVKTLVDAGCPKMAREEYADWQHNKFRTSIYGETGMDFRAPTNWTVYTPGKTPQKARVPPPEKRFRFQGDDLLGLQLDLSEPTYGNTRAFQARLVEAQAQAALDQAASTYSTSSTHGGWQQSFAGPSRLPSMPTSVSSEASHFSTQEDEIGELEDPTTPKASHFLLHRQYHNTTTVDSPQAAHVLNSLHPTNISASTASSDMDLGALGLATPPSPATPAQEYFVRGVHHSRPQPAAQPHLASDPLHHRQLTGDRMVSVPTYKPSPPPTLPNVPAPKVRTHKNGKRLPPALLAAYANVEADEASVVQNVIATREMEERVVREAVTEATRQPDAEQPPVSEGTTRSTSSSDETIRGVGFGRRRPTIPTPIPTPPPSVLPPGHWSEQTARHLSSTSRTETVHTPTNQPRIVSNPHRRPSLPQGWIENPPRVRPDGQYIGHVTPTVGTIYTPAAIEGKENNHDKDKPVKRSKTLRGTFGKILKPKKEGTWSGVSGASGSTSLGWRDTKTIRANPSDDSVTTTPNSSTTGIAVTEAPGTEFYTTQVDLGTWDDGAKKRWKARIQRGKDVADWLGGRVAPGLVVKKPTPTPIPTLALTPVPVEEVRAVPYAPHAKPHNQDQAGLGAVVRRQLPERVKQDKRAAPLSSKSVSTEGYDGEGSGHVRERSVGQESVFPDEIESGHAEEERLPERRYAQRTEYEDSHERFQRPKYKSSHAHSKPTEYDEYDVSREQAEAGEFWRDDAQDQANKFSEEVEKGAEEQAQESSDEQEEGDSYSYATHVGPSTEAILNLSNITEVTEEPTFSEDEFITSTPPSQRHVWLGL
ncbi:hypothetical protein CspHIS471_0703870 [Cutaneotrichosporon sp. HIS471]|nr:hypothetical protein CspHIS471_0703870 [Cutaneotrichosporon sp. HIS471]